MSQWTVKLQCSQEEEIKLNARMLPSMDAPGDVKPPPVDALIGNFYDEIDLMAPEDTSFEERPFDGSLRRNLNLATCKLRRLRLSSSGPVAPDSAEQSNMVVKRIKEEEESTVITAPKRQKIDSRFSRANNRDVSLASSSFSPSPATSGRAIRKINRRIASRLGHRDQSCNSLNSIANCTLEDGEIRESMNWDNEGLSRERPKLPQKRSIAKPVEGTGGRMQARFIRYCYSKYHKYVSVVLYCPRGCDNCVFENKAELDKHLRCIHGVCPTKCPNEQSDVKCNETLAHPLAEHHLACFKCGLTFDCPTRLEIHDTFNHQKGLFVCAKLFCRYQGDTRRCVIEHFDHWHQRYGVIRFKTILAECPREGCRAWFAFKDELDRHLWWHHRVLPFQCLFKNCDRSYQHRFQLDSHVNRRHGNFSRFFCSNERCHRVTRHYSQLQTHMMLHHQRGQFACVFNDCNAVAKHPIDMCVHYSRFHQAVDF